MSANVHKSPWKLRPIVCCAGTVLNCLSRWLDYWFQKLKPSITTYIKDSARLLQKLKAIKQLPVNFWLFTVGAKSMYTNIDTNHALATISQWPDSIPLPEGFPLAAVKAAMELVMCNNITWHSYRHTCRLRVGYDIFFSHEITSLTPKFNKNLLPFLRFIDDIIHRHLDWQLT